MKEKFLENQFLVLYLIPFILGSLTVFSFQPFNLTFINFFILPICFYLITFINKKSKSTYRKKPYRKNLFFFGSSFGFGFYLSGIHWITYSLTFDDSFKFLIPVSLLLIPLFLSLFFSMITLVIGPYLKLNLQSIFLFSGSIAFSDYIRSKIFTGFPWNLWSYSFSSSTEILQILNLLGLFAFNLIIISFFMAPTVLFLKIKLNKKIFSLISLSIIFFSFYIYGNYSINQNLKMVGSIPNKYNIKVISPNFELEYNIPNEKIIKRLEKLIRYSAPEKNYKTLFVWPEGVFSGYSFSQILQFKKMFNDNFDKNHLILFGVNRLDLESKNFFNSAIIINNKMEILQEYKKQKLVPFGEFLPFEVILKKLGLKKITEGYGSFLAGKDQGNLIFNKLNILVLICYEIIFTELPQSSHENTNLIVNISEDGWFGNSIGPYQHFAKGVFRAIENNVYVIRSANKGVTAIINNKGEIVKKLKPREAGNIEYQVPLFKSKNKNRNDLIFFVLLITYIFIFNFYKEK